MTGRASRLIATFVVLGAGAITACSLIYDTSGLASGTDTKEEDGGRATEGTDGDADGSVPVGDASPSDAGADATTNTGPCHGDAGPTPVRIGAYCVDATEVTAAQYNLFFEAVGRDLTGQPAECAFNATYMPSQTIPPDTRPVRYVDWCDAFAYCKWAHKHLCGKIGGGAVTSNNPVDANDEWYGACSHGGTLTFPYGSAYDALACNGVAKDDAGAVVLVASQPKCTGGYEGLFDMSGNVREWEQDCQPGIGDGGEICFTRGGGADDEMSELRCFDTHSDARNYKSVHVGFRCCSE